MSVTIGPLVGMPDDREGWIAEVLREGVPSTFTLKRIAASDQTHAAGWPVTVVAVAVLNAGIEVERRIAIVFQLEVLGAIVLVLVAAHLITALETSLGRAVLVSLLDAPVRMHHDEVVALAELDT